MKIIAAILILWLPFSLFALISIPVLLFGMLTQDESIWRPVGKAMDRLMAATLGFSPDYTLSAQLGVSSRLQWLRWILDKIQTDHCRLAAINEKLIS